MPTLPNVFLALPWRLGVLAFNPICDTPSEKQDHGMSIDVNRIRTDIEAIARCTATPGAGATRPTFSPAWAEACEYVIAQAKSAGCDVRTDAAGNIHARPASLGWDAPAWLVGSHIDSVPNGGDY